MKKIFITAVTATLVCLAGCEQNKMPEYENSPAIYFTRGLGVYDLTVTDSIAHSFFLLPESVVRDTVWVKVSTMGLTSDHDRYVKVVQANVGKPNAAVAGTHYVAFDDPGVVQKMVVPAGAVEGRIPVVMLKHESLNSRTVRIEMEVAGNEYFRPGIDAWRKYVVTTTAMTEKPSIWDVEWAPWFGPTWGPVKFRFIIDVTGFLDWDTPITDDYTYQESMGMEVRQRFAEYNRDHPDDPMREANGDLVVFD